MHIIHELRHLIISAQDTLLTHHDINGDIDGLELWDNMYEELFTKCPTITSGDVSGSFKPSLVGMGVYVTVSDDGVFLHMQSSSGKQYGTNMIHHEGVGSDTVKEWCEDMRALSKNGANK